MSLILNHTAIKSELSQSIIDEINHFGSLIIKWNGLNLVSRSTLKDMWGWHFFEALSILNLLTKLEGPIVDFGAGGGVIGIPLAISGIKNIHLVERSQTKLTFLNTIANFNNVHSKIPFSTDGMEKFSVIIRGVDKIKQILDIFGEYIKKEMIDAIILFKATHIEKEIKLAQSEYVFDVHCFNRVGLAQGKIIILDQIKLK